MAEKPRYSHQELADMIFIYGECHKNQRQAAALYALRFPARRHPQHGFFHTFATRLQQTGNFHNNTRPIQVRHRDEEEIAQVSNAVNNNNHTSTRTIAQEENMHYTKVHRIMKKDLNLHPFKRHTTQLLLPGDFPRRLEFCDWLIDQVQLDNPGDDLFLKNILWTDECVFGSEGLVNRRNEHHYAQENPRCVKQIHVQGRWTLNVWAGILGDRIIGPEFIQGHVDAQYYSNFLQNRLGELLEDVPLATVMNMYFQQDGHPAHTALVARGILNQKFPGRWIGLHGPQEWPPRSSDLTPLDFFLWGYLKNKVYETLPASRNELMERIQIACLEITPQMLRNTRINLMRRIALCLEENGNVFEQLL